MNNTPLLEVERLTHIYRRGRKEETLALDQLSFSLGPGLYGLLGPNGAGKSTLLNIITCSLTPTSGRVRWNGSTISPLRTGFRRELGYMPQQQTLYDTFTGYRFLAYLCALKELPAKQIPAEVERAAALVNLSGELTKRLSAYSGGMKQRLLAAGAILGDPRLLIFDEPTAGLDPKERVRFRRMVKALSENRVVVIATHVVSDVEQVADGILLLKKGRLVCSGSPEQLIETYLGQDGSLEKVYLKIFGDEADVESDSA